MSEIFMDRVHAGTFSTKHRRPESGHILAQYRAKLRQAERFVLDNNSVELVCDLSHERDNLDGWSYLARLPYDVLWIEHDLHHKVAYWEKRKTLQAKFNADEVSKEAGFLLYHDRDARWLCHSFYTVGIGQKKEVLPGLLMLVFDPEGQPHDPVRGSKTWGLPTLSLRPGFKRIPVQINLDKTAAAHVQTLVDPELLIAGDLQTLNDDGEIIARDWFASRAAVTIDPYWHSELAKRSPEATNKTLAMEVRENMGLLRWMVTLLSSINALPKTIKFVPTRSDSRVVGMHRLRYFNHNNLSINLPLDDRVLRAKRFLNKAAGEAQRPWHKVRGHWRIIERGKAPPYVCRHLPVMVEEDVGMCERCELMIRWIADHARGDPTIGIIEHDTYQVHAKRPRLRHKPEPNKSPTA